MIRRKNETKFIYDIFDRPQEWELLRRKRKTTKALWAQEYPEAEYWPLKRDQYSKGVTSSDESTPTASNTPSQFTYDILKACMRQKSFYYQVGKVYYWYSIVKTRVHLIYFLAILS